MLFSRFSALLSFGMRTRLTLWFILVAIGAVVFGAIIVYLVGLTSIQGTLGQTYCQIASRVAGQFEDRVDKEILFVGSIATDALTTEVLLEEADDTRNRARQWLDARLVRLSQKGPWNDEVFHKDLARRLTVIAGVQTKKPLNISVFNLDGLLLASSTPRQKRVVSNSSWFQVIKRRTNHFTHVHHNKSANSISFTTPVWAGVGIVGYVRADLRASQFLELIDNVGFGQTGRAIMVDSTGAPLRGSARPYLVEAMSRRLIERSQSTHRQIPYWMTLRTNEVWPLWRRLACITPLGGFNARRASFSQPLWSIVVTQAPEESYAALGSSLRYLALAGLLGVVVAGGGGAIMAWYIARPITRLRDDVRRFGAGDRQSLESISVAGHDEIAQLAHEFKSMGVRVRDTENELRAFAKAVEGADDAIIMTDIHGFIVFANTAFTNITGYELHEVIGKRSSFLRSDKTSPEMTAAIRNSIKQALPWRGEIWNRRKSGEDYPADVTVSPIRNDDGRLRAFIGIHRDISLARKYREDLEREIVERTSQIRRTEGLAVMGRMASMIAHDLRNALSTIKMNMQMLLYQYPQVDSVENEQCKIGLGQVKYMEDILRDMLSYARPEKLQLDWHDVCDIVEEVVIGFAGKAELHKVNIIHKKETRLPKVHCDRVKLMQILRNLVQNAIHAMPKGGLLTIEEQLSLNEPQPKILILITDTGEGMDQDTQREVFEPFFTTRARGTGLGLAIVKRLIKQHEGEVSIQSRQGHGTCVTLELPTECKI